MSPKRATLHPSGRSASCWPNSSLAIPKPPQVGLDRRLQPGRLRELLVEFADEPLHLHIKRLAIVLDFLGDIYTIPMAGGSATRLTSGLAHDAQPRFSPDGRRIAFLSDRSGGDNLWVMNADGRDTVQLSRTTDDMFVSPELVKKVRAATQDRTTFYAPDELLKLHPLRKPASP